MNTKMTTITKDQLRVTGSILHAIGMSDEEHSTLIFERGCEYFEDESVEPSAIFRQKLMQSTIAWNWWRSQWYRRNGILAFELGYQFTETDYIRREFYKIHNVSGNIIYPSRVLLAESYAQMMDDFIKTNR